VGFTDPLSGTLKKNGIWKLRYRPTIGVIRIYPNTVSGKPVYGTIENRENLKQVKEPQWEEYQQLVTVEGIIGLDGHGVQLSYFLAGRADTSMDWINNIFLFMNLLILLRVFCRQHTVI